jgi:beta-glucosidase
MRFADAALSTTGKRLAALLGLCALTSVLAPRSEAQPLAKRLDPAVEQRVDAMLAKLSLEEKIDLLGGVDGFYVRALPSIGLPRLKMSDGPLGARNDGPATTMAGGIALAATWDAALAKRVGGEIGRDARARGVHFMLGPAVNIHVAPMNGRNFEYLGEDPLLAGSIASGYIEGMQAQGVSATVKHFVANNSEYDRHNVDVEASPRALREIYLPAFEAAVKQAHVGAIMTSYNLVDGAHMSQQGRLNNDVVKKQWGFEGLIMSDWVSTYDGVAAANGGLDLEMPAAQFMNRKTLLPAIKAGKLSVATLDDKVRRILRTAIRFGWLDREQLDRSIPLYNQEGNEVALQAARESMVLLKNEGGLLPLAKDKARTIAVIGPDAYPAVPVGGGSAAVRPFAAVGFLRGLSDALGTGARVTYARGVPSWAHLANATQFSTAAQGGKPGLTVESFENPDLSGPPASTKVERHINHKPMFSFADLADMDQGELFEMWAKRQAEKPTGASARWTGYYTPSTPGPCEVFVQVTGESGGDRLLIDGKVVLDNWSVRKALVSHATVDLQAGPHKVVFEHFVPGRPDFFGGTLRVGIAPEAGIVDPGAKALAEKADVVVVAAGFDEDSESEGGDRTFDLPFGQDELIREMAAASKNTVVVVTSGGAVDTRGWLDRVPAFLESWYPGQAGGTALAEILLGEADPSGRLPISYDKSFDEDPSRDSYYPAPGTRKVVYKNGVFVGYRGYEQAGTKPLYPFGYGLSYTTFAYANLELKSVGTDAAPRYEVSFDVTNTGQRAGADVAQVYVGEPKAQVPRPPKELKGFSRVELRPGESKRVSVSLDPRSFAYFDEASGKWHADAGEFEVLVGRSSADVALSGKLTLAKAVTIDPSE